MGGLSAAAAPVCRPPRRWSAEELWFATAVTALLMAPAPVLWAPPLTVIALMWPWREIRVPARRPAAARPANDNMSGAAAEARPGAALQLRPSKKAATLARKPSLSGLDFASPFSASRSNSRRSSC